MNDFNKNDKQKNFNQIKGSIIELNDGEKFCNITLSLGHENLRQVNMVVKKTEFDSIKANFKIGDRVCVQYYLSSRKKSDRWHTMANVLSVALETQSGAAPTAGHLGKVTA